MKRAVRCSFLIPWSLLLISCATPVRLHSVPAPDQNVVYQSGQEFLFSKKQNGSVGIGIDPASRGYRNRFCLAVVVANCSEQPAVFSTENVQVTTMDGKPIRVFAGHEILNDIENRRRSAVFFTALGGALQGMGAYDTASKQYHYGTINGPGYTATYQGYTRDPHAGMVAQQQVNENTERELGAINTNAAAESNAAAQKLLTKQTVMPNQLHGGMVVFDLTKLNMSSDSINVKIEFNGETHLFRLRK